MNLLERLHPEADPYAGFPLDDWPEDLQGWGSDHPLLPQAIRALRPRLIVEVGSWKGRSAVAMADACRQLDLTTTIVCVDTWLGSPEHFLGHQKAELRPSLHMAHGYPRLYFQFVANVLHRGHEARIVPLPQTSDNGAEILRRIGARPDLVYIDAAHEEQPVLQDLRAYFPLLADGGVLIGDDYKHGPVARAAHRFAEERGRPSHADGKKFVLLRDAVPDRLHLPPEVVPGQTSAPGG